MSREKNKQNDDVAIYERRQKVARLYVEGSTQCEIAERLAVSQPTVCLDLKAIRAGWEASAILDWDMVKTKELVALEHQIDELWKAWYRSCEVEEVKTRNVKREVRNEVEGKGRDRKVVGSKMVPTEVTSRKVSKQLIGDPRYMAEITKLRELRCRILGFLKDEKPAINAVVNVIDWDSLAKPVSDTIEERLALEQAKVVDVTSSAKDTGHNDLGTTTS